MTIHVGECGHFSQVEPSKKSRFLVVIIDGIAIFHLFM
jgi:hypothetical protein